MYISGMTTTLDTSKIQEYLNRRVGTINKAVGSLSLGLDKTEATLGMFSNYLTGFLVISSATDSSFFRSQFDKLYTDMIQPIPEADLAATGMTTLVHNKFTTLAQSILAHPACADFFYAAIQDGCKVINKDLVDLNSELSTLKGTFSTHLAEIRPYIDLVKTNPGLAFNKIVEENQEDISELASSMYLKLFELNASLTKDKDFATAKVESVFATANELNTILTGIEGLKSMPSSLGGLMSAANSAKTIWDSGNRLFDTVKGMGDIDTKITDGIDFSSLFNRNLQNVLKSGRTIESYCNNLTNLSKTNTNAFGEAARQVTAMLPYVQGLMKSMGEKNLKTKLFEPGPNRSMLDDLKSGVTSMIPPVFELNSLKNDMFATVQLTEDLMQGVLPPDSAMDVLSARMDDSFSVVDTFVDMATGVFSAFVPDIGDIADVAYAALKQTAPTPLISLGIGEVLNFQKALINPRAITQLGPAMDALSTALSNSAGETIAKVSLMNELMDFINREHVREITTTYLADPDLQKAVAISGLKKYVKTDIQPVSDMLTLLEFMDRERPDIRRY